MTPEALLDFPLTWPTFTRPPVLALLAAPLALLVWAWVGGRAALPARVVLPLDRAAVRSGRAARWAIAAASSLPPLALACVVCLLAGPQVIGPPKEKRSLTNVQFCVDVSSSMGARFGDGNRYDAAMHEVDRFLDFRKGDAFGLTFFGGSFVHWAPLTTDPSAVRCATPFMRPDVRPVEFGGTAIAKALRGCREELIRREEGDRMIVLVSDGYSSDLSAAESEIIREMVADRITVFAVIVGGESLQDEVVSVCHATGGEAFTAGDGGALQGVFRKIGSMKPAKILMTTAQPVEHAQPFALAGLVLTAAYALTLLGLRYTPW